MADALLRAPHLLSRRDLLKAGCAATLLTPAALLAAEESAKRGGILRVRGWDPPTSILTRRAPS